MQPASLPTEGTCALRVCSPTRAMMSAAESELSERSAPAVEQSEAQAVHERSTLLAAFLPFHSGARLERELFFKALLKPGSPAIHTNEFAKGKELS